MEREALRLTPAGVPKIEALIAHRSTQQEAGLLREVQVELGIVALGDLAAVLDASPPGCRIRAEGFLSARSLRNRKPVLHLTRIEFIEGN